MPQLSRQTVRELWREPVRLTPANQILDQPSRRAVFKSLKSAPAAAKYPHAARWYKHIATYEDDSLRCPATRRRRTLRTGPAAVAATLNPAKAPAKEEEDDDDDVDLFGSDDEEEDAEAARIRDERLAEYRKKKEAKPKTTAKSVVTMEVKPWGEWLTEATAHMWMWAAETE